MPKSCSWIEGFSDWLIECFSGDSNTSANMWCKYCNKAVKKKKYNAEKHASTTRHRNRIQENMLHSTKTKRESDHVLRDISYGESEKLLGAESPGESIDGVTHRISTGKRHKKQISAYEFSTISYPNYLEFHEVDAFAKSIAAQMKTLPEKYVIDLTFEIQNLVTQKRLLALEDKNTEKQAALENPQVITVSMPNTAPPTMQSSSGTYSYQ